MNLSTPSSESILASPRRFTQVDVFGQAALRGNPLAVVHEAAGLAEASMRRFANWTNLSETTYLLPTTQAQADYRVRIFTPNTELPFAGHPTLGSAHAWLEAGGRPQQASVIVQECAAGLVPIKRVGTRLAFAAPPLRRGGPLDESDVERLARGLGLARSEVLAHAWCDNGPHWRTLMLRSRDQLLGLKPDAALLHGLEVGVVAPCEPGDDEGLDFELRAFFPGGQGDTLAEDPVTGSLNAAVAQWLIGAGLAPSSYVAAQGTAMGRAGRVYVEQTGDTIWVGGESRSLVQGTVAL